MGWDDFVGYMWMWMGDTSYGMSDDEMVIGGASYEGKLSHFSSRVCLDQLSLSTEDCVFRYPDTLFISPIIRL